MIQVFKVRGLLRHMIVNHIFCVVYAGKQLMIIMLEITINKSEWGGWHLRYCIDKQRKRIGQWPYEVMIDKEKIEQSIVQY